jgi:hypothetical protein
MELLSRRAVAKAVHTKTTQGGCHGTRFIALAPRNSVADHTADLGVWRPARLIAAKQSAYCGSTYCRRVAEARLAPGLFYRAFSATSALALVLTSVLTWVGARFLGRRRYPTLGPWPRPTTTI